MTLLNESGNYADNNSSNANVRDHIQITSSSKADQATNKVQSAGPPGSAGMIGSKRWLKANMGESNNDMPMNS